MKIIKIGEKGNMSNAAARKQTQNFKLAFQCRPNESHVLVRTTTSPVVFPLPSAIAVLRTVVVAVRLNK